MNSRVAPAPAYARAFDDYRFSRARWGWPAFGLLAVLAALFGVPAEALAILTQLWLGWCTAWLWLALVRRLLRARPAAGLGPVVLAGLLAVVIAGTVAAASGWLLWQGAKRLGGEVPSHWILAGGFDASVLAPVAASAAALTALLVGVQASIELRLARARAQAAERERLITLERELLGSQLKVLQAQIEPHFLYNSLANVQQLVRQDAAGADRMLGHLIDYLRAAVPSMRQGTATLGSELDLARAYLAVMGFRMGERLQWAVDVPAGLLATPLPPTVIGTLIENAIKHGLERCAAGGRIDIRARHEAGMLVLDVADTGLGVEAGAASGSGGAGLGLANARERLVLLFGERAELDLMPNVPRGVIARMKIPLEPLASR